MTAQVGSKVACIEWVSSGSRSTKATVKTVVPRGVFSKTPSGWDSGRFTISGLSLMSEKKCDVEFVIVMTKDEGNLVYEKVVRQLLLKIIETLLRTA